MQTTTLITLRKTILTILLLLAYSNVNAQDYGNLPLLEKQKLKGDLELLHQGLDKFHSGMYWYTPKDSVDIAFQNAKTKIATDLNILQFNKIIAPLVALSREDHTDIQLPKESIQEVQTVYDEEFFVKHRGVKHKGWNSTCSHGLDGAYWKTMSGKQYGYESDSDNDIFWDWTDVCHYAPKTVEFFKKDMPLKNYRRLRYTLLRPEGFILEHSDSPSKKPPIPRKETRRERRAGERKQNKTMSLTPAKRSEANNN